MKLFLFILSFFFLHSCLTFKENLLDPKSPLSIILLLLNPLSINQNVETLEQGRAKQPSLFVLFYKNDSITHTSQTFLASMDIKENTNRFAIPINNNDFEEYSTINDSKITTHPIEPSGYLYYRNLVQMSPFIIYHHKIIKFNLNTGELLAEANYEYRNDTLGEEGNSHPAGFFYSNKQNKLFLITSPSSNNTSHKFFIHIFHPDTLERINKVQLSIGNLANDYFNGIHSENAIFLDEDEKIIVPIAIMSNFYDYHIYLASYLMRDNFEPLITNPTYIFAEPSYHTTLSFRPVFIPNQNKLIFYGYQAPSPDSTLRFYHVSLVDFVTTEVNATNSLSNRKNLLRLYYNPQNDTILSSYYPSFPLTTRDYGIWSMNGDLMNDLNTSLDHPNGDFPIILSPDLNHSYSFYYSSGEDYCLIGYVVSCMVKVNTTTGNSMDLHVYDFGIDPNKNIYTSDVHYGE